MSIIGAAFGLTPEWLKAQYQVIYPSTLLGLWDPEMGYYAADRFVDGIAPLVGPAMVDMGGTRKYYQEASIPGTIRRAINPDPYTTTARQCGLTATCSAPVISALAVVNIPTIVETFVCYPQLVGLTTAAAMYVGPASGRTFSHYIDGVATETYTTGVHIWEGIDTTPASAVTLMRIGTYIGNNTKKHDCGVVRALSAAPTPEQRAAEVALLARYYRRSFP